MGDSNGKRAAGGQEFSKRVTGRSFRDSKHEQEKFQYSNQIRCITKDNSMKSTKCCIAEKLKRLKPPLPYKCGNTDGASSSGSKFYSSCSKWKNEASIIEGEEIVESSIREKQNEDWLKFYLDFHRREEAEDSVGLETPSLHSFSVGSIPSSSSSPDSSTKYGKQINQDCGSTNGGKERSSLRQSYITRSTCKMSKCIPRVVKNIPQRYELRSLCCAPTSSVLSSGYLSDEPNNRAFSGIKIFDVGEASSSGMKSLQGQQVPQNNSTRSQSQINIRDDAVSVGSSRSTRGKISRMRFKEREDEYIVQPSDAIVFPQRSHASLSISEIVPERSLLPSAMHNLSLGERQEYSSVSQIRPVSHSEDRYDYGLFNIERITEVLQSLERIEPDGALTYEQLLVLESDLSEGFSFNDQHRDMRMDIDNMTYEDLLALEEKIGSVSTALPDEAFSKCLKKSTYRTRYHLPGISRHNNDDAKCSICQEVYVVGEGVGRLQCKHAYHFECIHQWLRLKNWCPICKAPAAQS